MTEKINWQKELLESEKFTERLLVEMNLLDTLRNLLTPLFL